MSYSALHGVGYSSALPSVSLSSDRDVSDPSSVSPGSRRQSAQSNAMPSQSSPRSGNYEGGDSGIETKPDRWFVETNRQIPVVQHPSSFSHNYNISAIPPSTPPGPSKPWYNTQGYSDPDSSSYRRSPQSSSHTSPPPIPPNQVSLRSTLWWGDLEPWMDEEYAKQVCNLMGWDPVNINIPPVGTDGGAGPSTNNPGYCLLTFPSQAHAASVLTQINGNASGTAPSMPNSSKPFVLNWASSMPSPASSATPFPYGGAFVSGNLQQHQKEYSIFVGDLAPETSNSDLVAVFRNPVLGLRNDREPKFIRPFLSCKSAKIMLDPVTGVSRGYGFVRFTDEADQQRALIEMHGLYCLSRPMRISPATAKFKQPAPISEPPPVQFPVAPIVTVDQENVTIALPLSNATRAKSLTAAAPSVPACDPPPSGNGSSATKPRSGSISGSSSVPSLMSGSASNSSISSTMSPEELVNLPHEVLAQIAQRYAAESATQPKPNLASFPSITTPFAQSDGLDTSESTPSRYLYSEESWKHHTQARAILSNLIGPNGEQLTSTDPYNTTVFVGGLSPLISEETLRTFFAPFGDIHYVKVPVGKHCGFVQFVKKVDAERAIEKMQGFPIGGSRIRLSWGRSQYKAAQAAAQAAQAAAIQAQLQQAQLSQQVASLTPEQVVLLLQRLGVSGISDSSAAPGTKLNANTAGSTSAIPRPGSPVGENMFKLKAQSQKDVQPASTLYEISSAPYVSTGLEPRKNRPQPITTFSPFSPEPNLYRTDHVRQESLALSNPELHFPRSYTPGCANVALPILDVNGSSSAGKKISPTSTRPPSASTPSYPTFTDGVLSSFPSHRSLGRLERPISRPGSAMPSHSDLDGQEQEVMQDLNGTLASLDLDQSWKGPLDNSPSMVEGPTPQLNASNSLSHSLSTS